MIKVNIDNTNISYKDLRNLMKFFSNQEYELEITHSDIYDIPANTYFLEYSYNKVCRIIGFKVGENKVDFHDNRIIGVIVKGDSHDPIKA